MTKLEELYAKRDAFLEYGSDVPEKLAAEIKEAESILLDEANEMILSYLPDELELQNLNKLVFAAEYENGKLCRIASSSNVNIRELFDNTVDIEAEDDEPTEDDPTDDPDRKRNPSIGFAVKFADGKIIKHTTARRTMIEALRYMGLERASKYRGETFKGYPLIGKDQRPNERGHQWQKNVDGWWVYVNMQNARAISCIKGVSEMLSIPLEIVMDEDMPVLPSSEKPKNRRARFSINGGEPAWKNRTVLNAVRLLLKEIPTATFSDVCEFFPKHLQGSYGVVASLADIEQRRLRNQTENSRWFLDDSEILTAADGVRFVVSNEWGDNFTDFQKHVSKELGWTIEEV